MNDPLSSFNIHDPIKISLSNLYHNYIYSSLYLLAIGNPIVLETLCAGTRTEAAQFPVVRGLRASTGSTALIPV